MEPKDTDLQSSWRYVTLKQNSMYITSLSIIRTSCKVQTSCSSEWNICCLWNSSSSTEKTNAVLSSGKIKNLWQFWKEALCPGGLHFMIRLISFFNGIKSIKFTQNLCICSRCARRATQPAKQRCKQLFCPNKILNHSNLI